MNIYPKGRPSTADPTPPPWPPAPPGGWSASRRPRLRPVVNATGVVLHTNLGRASDGRGGDARPPCDAARGCLNLKVDLDTRQALVAAERRARVGPPAYRSGVGDGGEQLRRRDGDRAAGRGGGKEVIVSRGQLIEIGGSFRIPDIMAVSGAVLREVGTTNISRFGRLQRLGPSTGALMQRPHQQLPRIRLHEVGFSGERRWAKSRRPGDRRRRQRALLDFAGRPARRTAAAQSIAAGADLVLFSGDKLLGGPQAGVIAGRRSRSKIEKDPLMRAFRLDKMTLAALEATLRLYLNKERALREIPVLRLLSIPPKELRRRAEALAERLRAAGLTAAAAEDSAYVGGGSLPDRACRRGWSKSKRPAWATRNWRDGCGRESRRWWAGCKAASCCWTCGRCSGTGGGAGSGGHRRSGRRSLN